MSSRSTEPCGATRKARRLTDNGPFLLVPRCLARARHELSAAGSPWGIPSREAVRRRMAASHARGVRPFRLVASTSGTGTARLSICTLGPTPWALRADLPDAVPHHARWYGHGSQPACPTGHARVAALRRWSPQLQAGGSRLRQSAAIALRIGRGDRPVLQSSDAPGQGAVATSSAGCYRDETPDRRVPGAVAKRSYRVCGCERVAPVRQTARARGSASREGSRHRPHTHRADRRACGSCACR